MSHKDASAKQTQDDRDHFNHFDAPVLHYWAGLIAHAGFKIVSSARRNGFVPTPPPSTGPDQPRQPVFPILRRLDRRPISLFRVAIFQTQLEQDLCLSLGLARLSRRIAKTVGAVASGFRAGAAEHLSAAYPQLRAQESTQFPRRLLRTNSQASQSFQQRRPRAAGSDETIFAPRRSRFRRPAKAAGNRPRAASATWSNNEVRSCSRS
jgi:hypothetical protein